MKPDTKGHILYDCIYMEYPEQVNSQSQKKKKKMVWSDTGR